MASPCLGPVIAGSGQSSLTPSQPGPFVSFLVCTTIAWVVTFESILIHRVGSDDHTSSPTLSGIPFLTMRPSQEVCSRCPPFQLPEQASVSSLRFSQLPEAWLSRDPPSQLIARFPPCLVQVLQVWLWEAAHVVTSPEVPSWHPLLFPQFLSHLTSVCHPCSSPGVSVKACFH